MKQFSTQFQRPETLSRILGLSRFRPSLTDANTALMHLQLRNWGHVRDESKKALAFNDKNVKA